MRCMRIEREAMRSASCEGLDDKFICVVIVGDEVVTAYLINLERYVKYGVGCWRLIGDGRGVSA